MPKIAGTNPLTLAEDFASRQVASSATFQRITNAPSADEADAHVYVDAPFDPETGEEYSLDELVEAAPFAIVTTLGEGSLVYEPNGTGSYDEGGVVQVEIWQHAGGGSTQEVLRNAKNVIGSILEEMAAGGETPGHLARPTIRLMGIVRIDEDDRETAGDFVISSAQLAWGSLRGQGE